MFEACIEDPIDYRYADGRIMVSPQGVTVSNRNYLSSSETTVNTGIKDENYTYLSQLDVRDILAVSV
jgi:hypothetical protein